MEKLWGIGPLKIVTEQQVLDKHYVVIEGKKITSICDQQQLPAQCELMQTAPSFKLMPGMIDQHIHGIAGADAMDGTLESLQTMSTSLAKHGVTSFLATTMTADMGLIKQAVQTIAQHKEQVSAAKIIGIHLEGPFINPTLLAKMPMSTC